MASLPHRGPPMCVSPPARRSVRLSARLSACPGRPLQVTRLDIQTRQRTGTAGKGSTGQGFVLLVRPSQPSAECKRKEGSCNPQKPGATNRPTLHSQHWNNSRRVTKFAGFVSVSWTLLSSAGDIETAIQHPTLPHLKKSGYDFVMLVITFLSQVAWL